MVVQKIVELGILLFESLCFILFFDTFLNKRFRKHMILQYTAFASLLIIVIWILSAIVMPHRDEFWYSVGRFLVFTFAFWCLLQIFYDDGVAKKLVIAALGYALNFFSDFYGYLILYLTRQTHRIGLSNLGASIAMIFLIKLCLFLTVIIIRMVYTNMSKGSGTNVRINSKKWFIIILMPVISMMSIWTIFSLVPSESQSHPVLLILSLSWVFVCIIVFYLVYATARSDQIARDAAIINEKIRNSIDHAASDKRTYKAAATLYHDTHHHLSYISSLLQGNKVNVASEYIKKVSDTIHIGIRRIDTNSDLLNSILNEKLEIALSKNIGFNAQVNDLKELPFADDDLVIIISNLLDNAIEACDKCSGKKCICFKLVIVDTAEIVLSVKNTFNGSIKLFGGNPVTTKSNPDLHGLGYASIISRIKKYHGVHAFSHEGKEFQFTAIFPLKSEQVS